MFTEGIIVFPLFLLYWNVLSITESLKFEFKKVIDKDHKTIFAVERNFHLISFSQDNSACYS